MPSERVRRFVLLCGNQRNSKAIRSRTVFLALFADSGNASVWWDRSPGSISLSTLGGTTRGVPRLTRVVGKRPENRGTEAFLSFPKGWEPVWLGGARAATIVAGGRLIACAEHAAEMRRVVETVEERDLGHRAAAL